MQGKQGQNNNGYVPYVDYSRDYSPPPQHLQQYRTLQPSSTCNNTSLSNHISTTTASHLNGQMPNGNLSLTRNRPELRQDNGLPNIQSSMTSLPNVLLSEY